MMRRDGNQINFYAGYLRTGKRKQPRVWLKPAVPFVLLVGVLSTVFLVVEASVIQRRAELSRTLDYMQKNQAAYEAVQALEVQRNQLARELESLNAEASTQKQRTVVDAALFADIKQCLAGEFEVSVYRYDEETGTLTMDARARSVNLVPDLAERLRKTGRFQNIQYVGYTSDSDGMYYCTVGCTLSQPEKKRDE